MIFYLLFFFFFSSRRRHTSCGRDWSSDVCSSDLGAPVGERLVRADEGHAAHVARTRRGIGPGRRVRGHVGDAEPLVARETVLEQLAVTGLKDMQGLRSPWKKDDR